MLDYDQLSNPKAKSPRGSIGLASVLVAFPISVVASIVIVWWQGWSFWWSVPIYAVIGAVLTLGFSTIAWWVGERREKRSPDPVEHKTNAAECEEITPL